MYGKIAVFRLFGSHTAYYTVSLLPGAVVHECREQKKALLTTGASNGGADNTEKLPSTPAKPPHTPSHTAVVTDNNTLPITATITANEIASKILDNVGGHNVDGNAVAANTGSDTGSVSASVDDVNESPDLSSLSARTRRTILDNRMKRAKKCRFEVFSAFLRQSFPPHMLTHVLDVAGGK